MTVLTTWMLAGALTLAQLFIPKITPPIHVDCESEGALKSALVRAETMREVDIYLHGVCEGNFVIHTDGVTLRAGTPDAGLSAPQGNPRRLPVLEVVDAEASLRGLVVRGVEAGVLVHGWEAEVLLFDVEIVGDGAQGVGVIAERGARVRLLDSTLRDGGAGVVAQDDALVNLQNVIVSNQRVGIAVSQESFAAVSDSTIENNREAGLNLNDRSSANVLGGIFRENGQVHVNANDQSRINLLYDAVIGSETDATPFALTVARDARIASFTVPQIYGNVGAVDRGAIRLGNTMIDGDLILWEFSNAIVRSAEITGSVICLDGSDAICRQTTTAGAIDCPSPTCGSATREVVGGPRSLPQLPVVTARGSVRFAPSTPRLGAIRP